MAYERNIYDNNGAGSEETVYRYLCPVRKAGSIIGKGGGIAKQIRSETKANMRISEALRGCDERVVTIYSFSEETNRIEDDEDFVCPAFDALFKVHDMIVAEELDNDDDDDYDDDEYSEKQSVIARMLVPSDQIGCLIGKGGQVIQNLRNDTNAQIRVINDNLPVCALALSHDELLQIIGDPSAVREALYQVASLLYDNPSRFGNYLLSSSSSSLQKSGGILMTPTLTSSHKHYSALRDGSDGRVFSICFICPADNVGGVIGKGGCFIKQIRQESGATIRVNTSETDEVDNCIISISSKEFFEDQSPTVNAALRLQTRCSEKVGKDSSDSSISTRVLVPSSQVGCLIGKGGTLISEMRSVTKANIRIFQGENVPSIAREDEEMVQITGSLDAAIKALTQVMLRLRANVFDMDRGLVLLPTFFPYISQTIDTSSKPKHRNQRQNHSHVSEEIGRNEDYGRQMNSNFSGRNRVY